MGKSCLFGDYAFRKGIIVALAATFTALILSFSFANQAQAQAQAQAQQTDADFSAYCRAKFNNSTYQRFAQTWGTEHACVQGGTRQGIDLGAACFLTTGSRTFEISGIRVLCEGSAGDAPAANANDVGAPDFNRYCNENFPNSVYEKRAEPNGVVHYCRRPGASGGFTLQNIDLAEACRLSYGVAKYRISGDRVFCTSAGGSDGTVKPGPVPQPNPAPNPNPNPDTRPTSDAPKSDSPDTVEPMLACFGPLFGTPEMPETGEDGLPISGEWSAGTIPSVEQVYGTSIISGDPMMVGATAFAGYMEITIIFQCHVSFVRFPEGRSNEDLKMAISEACAIEPKLAELYEIMVSTGFWIGATAPHRDIVETPGMPDIAELCDCEPQEVPDFATRIEELRQQAEQAVIEEFAE